MVGMLPMGSIPLNPGAPNSLWMLPMGSIRLLVVRFLVDGDTSRNAEEFSEAEARPAI